MEQSVRRQQWLDQALFAAIESGSEESAAQALEAGASARAGDSGYDALRRALFYSFEERRGGAEGGLAVLKLLLERGADARAAWGEGLTPLMIAAFHEATPEALAELALAGARPSDRNESGESALHYAARSDFYSAQKVALLLSLGVDPSLKNSEGETAREVASGQHNWEAADALAAFEQAAEIDSALSGAGAPRPRASL